MSNDSVGKDLSVDDSSKDDRDYFYKRAEAELAMAQKTSVPEAVRAHYQIAGHYLDRVYGESGVSIRTDDDPGHLAGD